MKESVLRAAAIASLALALIMSVTTWVGLSSSSQRGSFFVGFFEFALILFLGVVAWALFNALADVVTVRTSLDVVDVRMRRIEEALGVREPEPPGGGAHAVPSNPGEADQSAGHAGERAVGQGAEQAGEPPLESAAEQPGQRPPERPPEQPGEPPTETAAEQAGRRADGAAGAAREDEPPRRRPSDREEGA